MMLGGLILMKWFGLGLIMALHTTMLEMLSAHSLAETNPAKMSLQVLHSLTLLGLALAPMLGGIIVIAVLITCCRWVLY